MFSKSVKIFSSIKSKDVSVVGKFNLNLTKAQFGGGSDLPLSSTPFFIKKILYGLSGLIYSKSYH